MCVCVYFCLFVCFCFFLVFIECGDSQFRSNFPMLKSVFPLCGVTQGSVNYRMRGFTVLCEFPHVEKWISTYADLHRAQCISPCVNSQFNARFPVWKSVSQLADIHRVQCTYACVNSYFFPCGKVYLCLRIYTRYGALPHAEIHCLMRNPSWGKVYFRLCGFTQGSVSRSVRTTGPILWNSIDKKIINSKTVKQFRNQYKKTLISNYE